MKEKFKTLLAALGYFILAVGIQLITAIICTIILGVIYTLKASNKNITNFDGVTSFMLQYTNYILLASSIITVLVLILIYKFKKRSIKNELLLLKTKKSNLALSLPLGLAVWLFNNGVISLIYSTGLFNNAFDEFNSITSPLGNGSLFSIILIVGIIAPFTEEFLFRGVIYRTLNRKFSIQTAIIIQAILFGIFHGNLVQGVYATFLGLVFGYITYKSNSLWPAVITHMTNNILAFVLPSILPKSMDSLLGYSISSILGIVILVVTLISIKKPSVTTDDNVNIY